MAVHLVGSTGSMLALPMAVMKEEMMVGLLAEKLDHSKVD